MLPKLPELNVRLGWTEQLNDPLWQQAAVITGFLQREPYEGQPATEGTEVRVLYTRREIYFGIICHDSQASGVVATQLRRDVTQELDDYFEIVIDSRHDRRNAYVFQINPLGTQRDALITNEQGVRRRTAILAGMEVRRRGSRTRGGRQRWEFRFRP